MTGQVSSRAIDALVERVARSAAERDVALDRARARERGVVHTPPAIARYVVGAADDALRGELGRSSGLASGDVVIVDPATGPGVFLAAALELARARGAPRSVIGLDIDEGAITRARAELEPAAREVGWPLRLGCADALASLAPVAELEDDDVVRVVLGNPPWAARSANRDAALTEALLEDFRRDASGAPLGERKLGVLSDDYVRFLRWSAELVRRARRGGVLAMVTNASFLDGPVHRAMRAALARWFDELHVVDLGGSSLIARDGERDENVFGVRPAVAITIGVRRATGAARATPRGQISLALDPRALTEPPDAQPPDVGPAALRIAALRGGRDAKLDALTAGALAWKIQPVEAPWRVARGAPLPPGYRSWPSLAEWMPFHREGLQTNRDELVIARDRETLVARLHAFAEGGVTARATAHWDPERARGVARELLRAHSLGDRQALDAAIVPIAYRPFDARWAIVHPALCHRPRPELARALAHAPLALVSARKDRGQLPWACFGATGALPDNCWLSTRSSCRARAFPLRDPEGGPNLDPALARATEDRIGAPLDGPTFLRWALAWLASRTYRERCDEALRADYPRIPAPRSALELARVAAAGDALVRALTEPAAPLAIAVHDAPAGRARVRGDTIERGGALWIEGIPEAVLALSLGHHAVLARWLERGAAAPGEIAGALGAIAAAAEAIEAAARITAETGLLEVEKAAGRE